MMPFPQVCPDITDDSGFTLDTSGSTPGAPPTPLAMAMTGDDCAALDYVGINGIF